VSQCRRSAKNFLILIATIVVSAAILACPSPLYAQCQTSDFPDAGSVAAAPSRPVESSAPDPILTGITETEAGFTHSWVATDTSQVAFSNLVKLGVWCNVEIRWNANSFLKNTVGPTSASGFGDNYLGGIYRFHRESKRIPSMAVGYTVKFDSANPIELMGSGYVDHQFLLMFGKTVGKTSVVANLNYFVIGTGHSHFNEKTEWTLMASRPIYRKLGVIGEIYYDSHLNQSNLAFGNSTWALTYSANSRLVIDGGAYVGFSSGPGVPGTSAFVGVSYAVGNLYRALGWGPQQKKEQ
jgi:Putative MetA-pathway of phenol degradation